MSTPRQVLVVDDNSEMRVLLRHHLRKAGFDVLSASNGSEALALLNDEPNVDLVLSDFVMPETDGYELLRRIRARRAWNNVPVVMLTGNREEEDVRRAYEAGASAYLFKPFQPKELVSQLLELFPQALRD